MDADPMIQRILHELVATVHEQARIEIWRKLRMAHQHEITTLTHQAELDRVTRDEEIGILRERVIELERKVARLRKDRNH